MIGVAKAEGIAFRILITGVYFKINTVTKDNTFASRRKVNVKYIDSPAERSLESYRPSFCRSTLIWRVTASIGETLVSNLVFRRDLPPKIVCIL